MDVAVPAIVVAESASITLLDALIAGRQQGAAAIRLDRATLEDHLVTMHREPAEGALCGKLGVDRIGKSLCRVGWRAIWKH